jgi:predicted Zn-dependent protease with MMP-like domain
MEQEDFSRAAAEAIQLLPDEFKEYMDNLAVDVQDMPDPQTVEELRLKDRRSLLGLYRGVPLTRRSVGHVYRVPERIVLYQRNIERICRSREEVVEQIRRTVLHEIGHHFGFGERRLRELGY